MNSETQKKVDRIMEAYTGKEHSPEAEDAFAGWLLDERHAREKERALTALWRSSGKAGKTTRYAALKKVKARLGHPLRKHRIGGWRVGLAAAVLLLLLTVGRIWWADRTPTEELIPLKRELAFRTGQDATADKVLPDRTKVRLNENSSVVYDKRESGAVYARLSGEALFEVETRPGSSPFIVKTAVLEVRVHGTRFNVREYPGEDYTTVTLEKGKVEVALPESSVFMDPGYLLTYIHSTGEVLYDALPQRATVGASTQAFSLDFHKAGLYEILERLSDHYGLEFRIGEGHYLSDPITVRFDGSESTEDLMFILQSLSGGFSYTIYNDTVDIHPR